MIVRDYTIYKKQKIKDANSSPPKKGLSVESKMLIAVLLERREEFRTICLLLTGNLYTIHKV